MALSRTSVRKDGKIVGNVTSRKEGPNDSDQLKVNEGARGGRAPQFTAGKPSSMGGMSYSHHH
jgi:hypothetical protein